MMQNPYNGIERARAADMIVRMIEKNPYNGIESTWNVMMRESIQWN
jgi:hypothetical protein